MHHSFKVGLRTLFTQTYEKFRKEPLNFEILSDLFADNHTFITKYKKIVKAQLNYVCEDDFNQMFLTYLQDYCKKHQLLNRIDF